MKKKKEFALLFLFLSPFYCVYFIKTCGLVELWLKAESHIEVM
jgi:hypothetical protein